MHALTFASENFIYQQLRTKSSMPIEEKSSETPKVIYNPYKSTKLTKSQKFL